MIGLCFNPECNQELRYLRHGSVYVWESRLRPEHSEFFWLCSACSRTFEIASDEHGKPILSSKSLRAGFNGRYSRLRRVLREVVREDVSQIPPERYLRPKFIARRFDAA